jgi:hypothetical protein
MAMALNPTLKQTGTPLSTNCQRKGADRVISMTRLTFIIYAWPRKTSIAFILFLLSWSAMGQYDKNYVPRKTYNAGSKELIASIRTHLQDEIDRIHSRKKSEISHIYLEKTNYLIGKVKQEVFIQDDTLQAFAERILKRILANNVLYHPPRRILILKNPEVNAFCYLEGTFVITIGLMAKVKNESELAFAIAHELAHFELDHLRKRITRSVETKLEKTVNRELAKVYTDDVTLQEIDSVKKFVYNLTRHNREAEKQADSLGFIFFRKAGYNQRQAINLLSILDSADYLKYPVGKSLFTPLDFTKFPFKSYWLHQRPRVFSKQFRNTFIFDNDSIRSHPDIMIRKGYLHGKIEDVDRPLNYQEDSFVNAAIAIAEFEAIESAYDTRQFDRCLFLGLESLLRYPHHQYLIGVVTRAMLAILEAKEDGSFNNIVPSYTSQYSEELRQVNNFVHNISSEETGEIAFHFLNNQSNFNRSNEEHYYLLWRICELTHRRDVSARIKQSYRSQFEHGRFLDKMK